MIHTLITFLFRRKRDEPPAVDPRVRFRTLFWDGEKATSIFEGEQRP
jgi:hypothetical protein